uniref:Uncharacterized protein n=1 Tax=Rhizophora mucronata TaxID=61149 RepID=A0A2P2QUY9_RHIMU
MNEKASNENVTQNTILYLKGYKSIGISLITCLCWVNFTESFQQNRDSPIG